MRSKFHGEGMLINGPKTGSSIDVKLIMERDVLIFISFT